MENEKKKQQCKIAKSNKIMPKSHKADSDSHDVLCSLCSKLLGGGVESMAITEAFGGEETPAFLFINPKVSQQIITCLIYKKWILSLFVRVPHRKNPAVSHALWWVKQFQASFFAHDMNISVSAWSHCTAARGERLLRRKSHLHRHREHVVSLRLKQLYAWSDAGPELLSVFWWCSWPAVFQSPRQAERHRRQVQRGPRCGSGQRALCPSLHQCASHTMESTHVLMMQMNAGPGDAVSPQANTRWSCWTL